jgi:hypothetical protein
MYIVLVDSAIKMLMKMCTHCNNDKLIHLSGAWVPELMLFAYTSIQSKLCNCASKEDSIIFRAGGSEDIRGVKH